MSIHGSPIACFHGLTGYCELCSRENGHLRCDAERYRWLRSQHGIGNPRAAVAFHFGDHWVDVGDERALDFAIDAEMEKKNE